MLERFWTVAMDTFLLLRDRSPSNGASISINFLSQPFPE